MQPQTGVPLHTHSWGFEMQPTCPPTLWAGQHLEPENVVLNAPPSSPFSRPWLYSLATSGSRDSWHRLYNLVCGFPQGVLMAFCVVGDTMLLGGGVSICLEAMVPLTFSLPGKKPRRGQT